MKRLLLLAITAGLLFPVTAKAKSYWLVLIRGESIEKIQMKNEQQCKTMGSRWMNRSLGDVDYTCLEGK